MSIQGPIGELIREGVVSFYHDYRTGTFYDWSGNSNTGTPTGTSWSRPGIQFNISTAKVTIADSPELQGTTGCLLILGQTKSQANGVAISKKDAGGTNYEFGVNATQITLYDGTNTRFLARVLTSDDLCTAINFNNGSIPEVFINGLSEGNMDNTVAISANNADLIIGNDYDDGNNLGGQLEAAMGFTRELTDTEHSEVYAQLVNMHFDTRAEIISHANIKIDTTLPGLIGAWETTPINNSLIDLGSVGNDGPITSPGVTTESSLLGEVLQCGRAGGYIDTEPANGYIAADSPFSCSTWFRVFDFSGSQYIIFASGSNTGMSVYVAANKVFGFLGNGVSTGTIPWLNANVSVGTWWNLVFDYDGATGRIYLNTIEGTAPLTFSMGKISEFTLGGIFNGASTLLGNIGPVVRMLDRISTAEEREKWYQEGHIAGWQTGWGVNESVADEGGVIGAYLSDTPFQFGDAGGRWRIVTEVVNGEICKVIECMTSGFLYMPIDEMHQNQNEAIFGTLDFWFKKVNASGSTFIGFVSDADTITGGTQNGYVLSVDGNEFVRIYETTNGALEWKTFHNNPISLNDWNRYEWTRNIQGLFVSYINDSPNDLNNSNPDTTHTSANVLLVQMTTGDKALYSDRSGNMNIHKGLFA